MNFKLKFSEQAVQDYRQLEIDSGMEKRLKAVRKTLSLLEQKPRHPSLHIHEFTTLSRIFGKKVFEAYAENRTPSAYRVFWCYGPERNEISIVAITPHH